MTRCNITFIEPSIAVNVSRDITSTLPEWFGIPKANERYEKGMLDRISLTASINNDPIGMITLEFPYPNNANIYWMAIKRDYHGKGVGKDLVKAAEIYCRKQGCTSLTVETLSPKQNDKNYIGTYKFYESTGFLPLFEMHTYGPDNLMVYMYKIINAVF